MTPRNENDSLIAADGIRARNNGGWGKDKLAFIDHFGPTALKATQSMLQRYYVDLFAGPGRNVVEETREEFEGAAIRALQMSARDNAQLHFTHAYLVNKDSEDHKALQRRVASLQESGTCAVPTGNLKMLEDDSNRIVGRIMSDIDTKAYVFAFLDPTNPSSLPWSTLKNLKAKGHRSVDVYLLFPGSAINRMLAYNQALAEPSTPVLDAFFGTREWHDIYAQRVTDAQSREMRRLLLELYKSRLTELGWRFSKIIKAVTRRDNTYLYSMIYASNHEAGDAISDWSARRGASKDQGELF